MTTLTNSESAECVLRSLVPIADYNRFVCTDSYNTGNAMLNKIVADMMKKGTLTDGQHDALKRRLASCELNEHLDDYPGAKRYGRFVVIPGDG